MTGRGQVGELVARLTEARGCDEARDALRRTLGDPSLDLGFRQQETGRYTNDQQLIDAVASASALAIEKHQLDAELRANLEELRASRERIVEAAYDERRRIERNLHDGAQQRLVSLALELRLARSSLDTDPRAAGEMLDSAAGELDIALGELRELAHGIHPAILSDRGLGPALSALAARAPFEVKIYGVPADRLPERIESAAYFFVSEALTNAAKHADASRVTVSIAEEGGRVTVEVEDDGIGGADPARGLGLRGLADRVSALGGRLEITSPPGRGTALRATIPCGLKGEVDYGGGAPAGLTTPRQPS